MPNKKNNPKKTQEELKFERELKKLKLSAEHGAPFSDEKKEELFSESKEDFLSRMRRIEDAVQNPNQQAIRELLGFPNFPKVEDLSDNEIGAAIDLVNTALVNENIILDVIYPTPEREIYRFITEELLMMDAGMAGAGGMTLHLIYEEFYPNHPEEIKADVSDLLHFICRGYKGSLPWRIAYEVELHGRKVPEEEFASALEGHRHVFKGMTFIAVDSIKTEIDETTATANATFRYYLDQSSGTPGENSAEAEFYFERFEDSYLLSRLVINEFGIR